MFDQLFDAAFLESVVRATIPIFLAAIGGLIAERAGVFQIALEGLMLTGAFSAMAVSFWASSSFAGVVMGGVAGVVLSLILAYGVVDRRADPIVLGIAINLFVLGLTGFLLAQLFDVRGTFSDPRIIGLSKLRIPFLSSLPLVGDAFFNTTALGYLALLLAPLTWFVLFRTPIGLRLRGVGERPGAAVTYGVSSRRYKYVAVALSGLFAGLAGAQLALGNVVLFSEGMTSGRGWIAVVAVMLGRANPFGVLGVVTLFGLAEALGFRLQGNGLPVQITDALPFVITIVVLVVARKRFSGLLDLSVSAENT
jgi:ABC-type uncharacterized transport system permease subunit